MTLRTEQLIYSFIDSNFITRQNSASIRNIKSDQAILILFKWKTCFYLKYFWLNAARSYTKAVAPLTSSDLLLWYNLHVSGTNYVWSL